MGLKIMKADDGTARPMWYARFTRNGQKVNVNLRVPIRGAVPVDANGNFDVNGKSDAAFAKSRAAALVALADMQAAAKTTGDTQAVKDAKTADMVNRYHKARTGKGIKSPRLSNLPSMWIRLERNTTPTAERTRAATATFIRFAKFAKAYCRENGGACATVDEITPEIAAAWFNELKGAYAWGTVLDQWHLMSKSWVRWHIYTNKNPFGNVVVRNSAVANGKVERRPLTECELARLFDVTAENHALHDLVVCAACTGMRIGDVCRLKWADVDLRGGFIDTVTAKAGVRVTLPIFAPLRKVLDERNAKHAVDDSPYVFPVQAAQYDHVNKNGFPDQRTGIVRMVKPYFARAVFAEPEPAPAELADAEPMATPDVLALIDGARFAPAKKERLRDVFTRFRNGEQCAAIAAALNMARGQVSEYLKDVERLTGETYRPRIERKRATGKPTSRDLVERTRAPRAIGKHSASLFGWHNLRHTFVVLALQNGVPVNDVSRIVGHGDVETTLRNYGNTSKEVVAERTRERMRGTVLETGTVRKAIAATVDVPADGNALAPVNGKAAAVRALALARAVMPSDQAATVAAVIQAAGVDADGEPERALALIAATVDADTRAKINAVVRAAGI